MFNLKLKLIEIVAYFGTWIYFLCIFLVGFPFLPGYLLFLFFSRRWLIKEIKKYSEFEEQNHQILNDLWWVLFRTNPSDNLLSDLSEISLGSQEIVEGYLEEERKQFAYDCSVY